MLLGFFMITVDATIITVGVNTIQRDLGGELSSVMWVTSGYLLTFAVPLLITGRIGDHWGIRRTYFAGLAIFLLASLWCGLATSLHMLVAARVLQGFGAALLTPQTMALITRVFPPSHRGKAMGYWGGISGVASLVGPLAGGVLIEAANWRWIFLINVPIGLACLGLAVRYLPVFPTRRHGVDYLSIGLSAIGMFLLVFGIQEGVVWSLIAGVVVLAAFTFWESRTKTEPLMPLALFADRNFTVGSIGMGVMGALVMVAGFPVILYAQNARDLTAFEASLLLIPQAAVSAVVAPWVGNALGRLRFREFALIGFGSALLGMVGYLLLLHDGILVLWLLAPSAAFGVANAFVWGTLSTAATRNVDPSLAGAASGMYNTIRQVGSVLGSALIAMVMAGALGFYGNYTAAMGAAMWLPVALSAIGFIAAFGLEDPV